MFLERLAEGLGERADRDFVAVVPAPLALFLSLNQAGFLQDGHVMGDGGLGNADTLLDVTGAKAGFFPEGAGAFGFEGLQNLPASRIADGMEQAGERLILSCHGLTGIDGKSTGVNV